MIDIICKDGAIASNVTTAISNLNEVEFSDGLIATSKYLDSDNKLQVVLAVGKKSGSGRDSYQIISLKESFYVAKVVDENPELVYLVHGDIYIWYDKNTGEYKKVYADENLDEAIEVITSPITVTTYDGKVYEIIPGKPLFSSTNYYTKEEVDQLIAEAIDGYDDNISSLQRFSEPLTPVIKLSYPENTYLFSKLTSSNVSFKLSLMKGDTDISADNRANFYFNNQLARAGICNKIISPSDCTKKLFENSPSNDVAVYTLKCKYPEYDDVETSIELMFVNPFTCGPFSSSNEYPDTNGLLHGEFFYALPENGFTWKGDLTNQRFFCAYPQYFGEVTHIYDINGLDYINDYKKFVSSMNGEIYTVYVKQTATTITDFVQTFIFN